MGEPRKGVLSYADTSAVRRELRIKRTKKLFIEATHALIQEYGIKNLSIRKLAEVTGHGSATLYSYFMDMDELIVFASIKSRREYLLALSQRILPEMSSLEQYRMLYEIFNAYSFAAPTLYMNMYFGPHTERIGEIFDEYYRLYPDEETYLPLFLYESLQKRNLFYCDQVFTQRLAQDGFIATEHADLIAKMIVRLQQTFLFDLTVRPTLDCAAQGQGFMEMFDHIIAMHAPRDPSK